MAEPRTKVHRQNTPITNSPKLHPTQYTKGSMNRKSRNIIPKLSLTGGINGIHRVSYPVRITLVPASTTSRPNMANCEIAKKQRKDINAGFPHVVRIL